MKKSELEGRYVKNETNENLKSYQKQMSFCSKLYKKMRKKYFEMLDLKNMTDNNEFRKTVKPFLFDKVTTFSKKSLVEKGEIISDESIKLQTHLVIYFKMLYVHLVLKQTNILRRIMI